MILSALFLALAYVLPFLTGSIPQIGSMLCPMHIPVLLCGFVCGAPWGTAIGSIAPLLRSFTLGMPPLFPTALCMAAELAAYGLFSGLFYRILPRRRCFIYASLVIAMLIGRIVWGTVRFLCTGLDASKFGFAAFWTGAVVNAVPGIIVQIVLIPIIIILLEKANLISDR